MRLGKSVSRTREYARRITFVLALSAMAIVGVRAQSLAGSDAAAGARSVIDRLHSALVDVAASQGNKQVRYDALLPIVRETHDLSFIAELTIRRQWRELDVMVRERFVAAFENLSVATYATRFDSVGPETFRIIDVREIGDGRVEVDAEIVRAVEPNVVLAYVLQKDDDAWRIVNILADGVSDLALKRAQYQRILRDGGTVEELIDAIGAQARSL